MQTAQKLGGLLLAAAAIFAATLLGHAQEQGKGAARPLVLLAAIEGPIGPATTRHVEKVIAKAEARHAEALVLRLNTPGGLADAMRQIISRILTSRVPVIGYVAPPGAHAASAGTYILYACQIAAMAPGTNLGAATPIQIGGLPGAPGPGSGDKGQGQGGTGKGGGESSGKGAQKAPLAGSNALSHKMINDAVALIRSLAEMHGRNADWAEKAVREAASLSASQALKQNVIDLMADNVHDLLQKVDGRTVTVLRAKYTLHTANAVVEKIAPDTITRLLGVLSNPNVAFILMMIGVYGLIFEFVNPGAVLPGVLGGVCLVLGLYALNQLPLDYAGLALVLLGIALMTAEAFTPTFGILGISGLAAFVLGAAMLFDTDVPAYQLSWWLIGVVAAFSGGFLVLVLGYTVHAYRRGPVSGRSRMIGAPARVLEWSDGDGYVWTEGERWRATGPNGLAPGETVRVRHLDGLTLTVERDSLSKAEAAALRCGTGG